MFKKKTRLFMKRLCVKCQKSKENDNFTVTEYIQVDGEYRTEIICYDCIDKYKMKCELHGKHVIFIDLTHACAECVQDRVLKIIKTKWFNNFFKVVMKYVKDQDDHNKLVRVATHDDTLDDLMCFAVSFEAFCGRMNLTRKQAKIIILVRLSSFSNQLVDAILPSSQHE